MNPRVQVGQVWADNDKRASGRTVRVENVDGRYVQVVDSRGRRSRILIERMRPTSTGYRLLEEAPDA
ncbi:hypothetical protein [Nonomuraea longicatena]|uniref:Uncharacterized protein n=1 Tax=Nonomuraea longicatena TaxID=83682 RepID=A0ABP3ZCN1_9ACTN